MRLIFVRHGDTIIKAEDEVQAVNNPISPEGLLQAKDVAERLHDYNIDLILSSPLPRARDTANAINETLHKDLVFNYLLSEVKWPTELEGKKLSDAKVINYIKMRNENNIAVSPWHYTDEENFLDLKIRARKLLNEIKKLKEENILAVTHSTFMKVVVTVMCHGDDATWPIYFNFLKFTKPKHTSISTFDLADDGTWHLDAWNI